MNLSAERLRRFEERIERLTSHIATLSRSVTFLAEKIDPISDRLALTDTRMNRSEAQLTDVRADIRLLESKSASRHQEIMRTLDRIEALDERMAPGSPSNGLS